MNNINKENILIVPFSEELRRQDDIINEAVFLEVFFIKGEQFIIIKKKKLNKRFHLSVNSTIY